MAVTLATATVVGAAVAATAVTLLLTAGPAGAATGRAGVGRPPGAARSTTAGPAARPASTPSGFSRQDRGLVLVVLTFVVGVGLLGIGREEAGGPASPVRRRITLYDDPAAAELPVTVRREGRPPPLR